MAVTQVKFKKRVANHGEVYIALREVNAMLDLVKQETERIESRFLEPACGNGNFLIEVLTRKLTKIAARYGKSIMTMAEKEQLGYKIGLFVGPEDCLEKIKIVYFLKGKRLNKVDFCKEYAINQDEKAFSENIIRPMTIANLKNNINSDDVFENIRQELLSIKDEAKKTQAIKALNELKTEQNKPAFSSKYMKFIGIIADHITPATPLIQTLTRLIP